MHLDQYGNSYICVCVEAMDWYLMSSTKKRKKWKEIHLSITLILPKCYAQHE